MAEKTEMIKELGESQLLLPGLVNAALAANDRVKYFFTLLQTARSRAEHPDRDAADLRAERESAGVDNTFLDNAVSGARRLEPGKYSIPFAGEVLGSIRACMEEMLRPVELHDKAASAK